jgi:hypothetical protein
MEEIAIINSRELRQQALFSLDVRIPRWYKGLHPVAAFSGRANSALPWCGIRLLSLNFTPNTSNDFHNNSSLYLIEHIAREIDNIWIPI